MSVDPNPEPDHQGFVAAGDPRTARAGAQILEQGGNAADAAIASTLAAFAAEPILTGPFGGGFATIAGPDFSPTVYDFFADIPGLGLGPALQQEGLDFVKLDLDFGAATQSFHVGKGATAMGWLLPGLLRLHRDYGGLALEHIAEPAIRLAAQGVPLNEGVAKFVAVLDPIITHTPPAAAVFAPSGSVLKASERYYSEDLQHVLESFGQGRTASIEAALLDHFGPPAGRLTQRDFTNPGTIIRQPLRVDFRGYEILLNPPPAAGGLLVAFGLKLLAGLDQTEFDDPTKLWPNLVAAMAATNAARGEGLDQQLVSSGSNHSAIEADFLGADNIHRWRGFFDEVRHKGFSGAGETEMNLGGTTHISAVDAQGNAVSITSSNGEGCGHIIPGHGVLANNFMGEEDLHPGGFHSQESGTRLVSMMCPVVVCKNDKPVMAIGTGGSNRIRTALLQVLTHCLARNMGLSAAVGMPRTHFEAGTLYLEKRGPGGAMNNEALFRLNEIFPKVVPFADHNMFFGGVHAVDTRGEGVGDPRRGGHLAVAQRIETPSK